MIIDSISARQAAEICRFRGVGMIDYLERSGIFISEIKKSKIRGKKRRYTFKDVLVLKMISVLLGNGASVTSLKSALSLLRGFRWKAEEAVLEDSAGAIRHLILSGGRVYFTRTREELVDLSYNGQLSFSFLIDMDALHAEVQREWRQDRIDLAS